ncbi:MAG TPA: DUF3048 domain-containing protein [Acidimicrobiales bacterium]|nr:DUF3048 domain-containing protein [Acidimicrobiales bacterium]
MANHSPSNKPKFLLPKSPRARILTTVIVLVAAAGIAVALTRGGNTPGHAVTLPTIPTTNCPLTDTPAPGNVVPNRPALAIKIGNEPFTSRPQSGLNEADVVFDTPAEGFIMRYIAVYQCQNATEIGPTRSLRWVDSRLVNQLGHPILAFAGGIIPDVNPVMGLSTLSAANLLEGAQAAAHRTTNRQPPDNLYTSTSALYGLFPNLTTPPQPIFTYSMTPPKGGIKIRAFRIFFSQGTEVLWEWMPQLGLWVHTYARSVDHDAATGAPVTTTNIAVISAKYTIGPYLESPGGSGDIESQVTGSGPGYVLRNGEAIKVTWSRQSGVDPMVFKDSLGKTVPMAPGRTWVEIVPDTIFSSSAIVLFHQLPAG